MTIRTGSGRPPGAALRSLVAGLPDAIRETNLAVGHVLEAAIKEELSTPGQGREYPRGKGGRTHRASRPGDPPAPDTGALRNSIHTEAESDGSVRTGTNQEYAGLEYGMVTPQGATVEPRPYMRPALAAVEGALARTVAATLPRALARHARGQG